MTQQAGPQGADDTAAAPRQPKYAIVAWGTRPPAPEQGQWFLCLELEDGELMPVSIGWELPRMPSLMERYDALAYLGYAVVEGGAEAWEWTEGTCGDGSPVLGGRALIRPLTPEEAGAVGPQRSDATG